MDNWNLQTETDISYSCGAGGIVSTPSDLVKFSDALFGGKLIKNEHLEQMKTMKDNYGMGLWQMPFHEKTGYGHMGLIDGFVSSFRNFSDEDVSFAIISNGINFTVYWIFR